MLTIPNSFEMTAHANTSQVITDPTWL